MLLVDTPRPTASQLVPQRFRLANTRKRIALRVSYKTDDANRLSPVLFLPTMQDRRTRRERIRLLSQVQFRNRVIQGHAALASQRSPQALPHGVRLQQVRSFALGCNLLPKCDGHNDSRWFAGLVGHDLYIDFGHSFILAPEIDARGQRRSLIVASADEASRHLIPRRVVCHSLGRNTRAVNVWVRVRSFCGAVYSSILPSRAG
jgi:hypothetical protein